MDYVFHVLVLVVIFGLLSASLELLVGRIGLLSLCHAAFFGTGAYAASFLAVQQHWGFGTASLGAMVVAMALSLLTWLPSLRLTGDYFAIATLGIQIVLWQLFNNWTHLTGGSAGISNIPSPDIFGWRANSPGKFFLLVSIVAGIGWLGIFCIVCSPFGRVLLAVRENECLVQSFGKNPVIFKLKIFAVSAAIAGLSGSLYAYYANYIDPGSFTLSESILVLAMVVIGGIGSLAGPWIGAFTLLGLPEALRFLGLSVSDAASVRQVLYGLGLVALVLWRPRGLVGRFGFEK